MSKCGLDLPIRTALGILERFPLMATTVYSTPNCVQCRATYRKLDQLGIEYTKVILVPDSADDAAVQAILAADPSLERVAPMVIHEQDGITTIWTGNQPDMIDRHLVAA